MSSIYRLIIRKHSVLPINTKNFAFYLRKLQVCLFADRNVRFGPVPTGIVPVGCDTPTPPCKYGPALNAVKFERKLAKTQLHSNFRDFILIAIVSQMVKAPPQRKVSRHTTVMQHPIPVFRALKILCLIFALH